MHGYIIYVPGHYVYPKCACVYTQTLRSCSEKFPIRDYTVNVNNSNGFLLPTSILPGNTVTRRISNMDISQLQRDMMYSLNVTACSNFSCKQSNSILFCKYILFIQAVYMYVYKYTVVQPGQVHVTNSIVGTQTDTV